MSNKMVTGSILFVVLLISVVVIYDKYFKCVPKYGAIGFGSGMGPTGKCCKGLEVKSPPYFAGGGYCMESGCEFECKYITTASEGWYDSCTGELVRKYQCSVVGLLV